MIESILGVRLRWRGRMRARQGASIFPFHRANHNTLCTFRVEDSENDRRAIMDEEIDDET